MSTTGQNAPAERIAPQKDEGHIAPSVKYFTQNGMNGAYKRLGQLDKCLPDRAKSIVMKALITALAITAILATSAVAKTQRPKEVRVQPNNSVSHNA
jgi:hypothetical protein